MIIKKRSELINDIVEEKKSSPKKDEEEKIDLFDLDDIDFSQRQERRRGDRRRGYRRIDDRNLISRAQEEAQIIRENAAKEGYKDGLEKVQQDISSVKSAMAEFLRAREEVFEYIAPDILEISVDIARKIVKKEIEQNPEIVLETIMDVLKTLPKEESKISIKVHPQQLQLVKGSVPEMIDSMGLEVRTIIIADGTIELGSCIVQTSNGIVDATIDTQLEIIKEVFKGM